MPRPTSACMAMLAAAIALSSAQSTVFEPPFVWNLSTCSVDAWVVLPLADNFTLSNDDDWVAPQYYVEDDTVYFRGRIVVRQPPSWLRDVLELIRPLPSRKRVVTLQLAMSSQTCRLRFARRPRWCSLVSRLLKAIHLRKQTTWSCHSLALTPTRQLRVEIGSDGRMMAVSDARNSFTLDQIRYSFAAPGAGTRGRYVTCTLQPHDAALPCD